MKVKVLNRKVLVVCLLLLLGVLFFGIKKNYWYLVSYITQDSFYTQTLSFQLSQDKLTPDDMIIMFGDSLVQGLSPDALGKSVVNFGIGGETISGLRSRLLRYQSIKNARFIFIHVGINDLKSKNDDEIIKDYELMLAGLSLDTPLLIHGLLKVDENVYKRDNYNQRIDLINVRLKLLVEAFRQATYIDSNSLLMSADGNLSTLYHRGDGLHLSKQGYAVWINYLSEAFKLRDLYLNK